MTQEFEDWAENYQGNSGDVSLVSWQASREQLKAKLLSDEMLTPLANIISDEIYKNEDREIAFTTINLSQRIARIALEAIAREI